MVFITLAMMDFNISYVTHSIYTGKVHEHHELQHHTSKLVNCLQRIELKFVSLNLTRALQRISVYHKPRIQKLNIIERMAKHRVISAFFKLKRHMTVDPSQIIHKTSTVDYPSAIVTKVISNNNNRKVQETFERLKRNKKFLEKIQGQLKTVQQVHKQYVNRNFFSPFFRTLAIKVIKSQQYLSHFGNLQYLLDCIRVRQMFRAFTEISVKTVQKNIGQLQKQRFSKREQTRTSNIRKNQHVNDLKRKIHNLLGQINENQINNNRRKLNGVKENAFKFMKLNELIRISETNIGYLQYQMAKITDELKRKQTFARNRSHHVMPFLKIKGIYQSIQNEQIHTKASLQKVVPQKDLTVFTQTANFHTRLNSHLKQMMNLYERISHHKSDIYSNTSNENNALKQLLGSLIRHQLMQNCASELVSYSKDINRDTASFVSESRKVRSSTSR